MASKNYIGLARLTEVFTLLKNKLLTIKNSSNTAMTKRYILQFKDAKITDDSADGATKVEVVTELQSESDFDNLPTDGTADGAYCFPDSGEEYLTAENIAYGNKSVSEVLGDLTTIRVYENTLTTTAIGEFALTDFPMDGKRIPLAARPLDSNNELLHYTFNVSGTGNLVMSIMNRQTNANYANQSVYFKLYYVGEEI